MKTTAPSRPARWWFKGVTIGALLIILVGIEVFLRLINPYFLAGLTDEKKNPAGMPYFKITRKNGKLICEPSKYYQIWGHGFRFEMQKPKGVYRIFVLGDSTANGTPFANPGAFAKWLEIMLLPMEEGRRFEVINAGQNGFPAFEVFRLEKQILAASPDLIIIYCANNEFWYHRGQKPGSRPPDFILRIKYYMEHLKIIQILEFILTPENKRRTGPFELEPDSMRLHAREFIRKITAISRDQEIREAVLDRYRSDLEKIIEAAQAAGAQIILCTVPVNARDYEPYLPPEDKWNPARKEEWEKWTAVGKEKFKNNPGEALLAFQKAFEIDDSRADLNFYLGHCWLRLGETERAWHFFQRALVLDPVRDRAAGDLNEVIQRTAQEKQALLADVAEAFRQRAQDTIPGDDLFVDNVHPTLEGQRIIAETILQTMIAAGIISPSPRSLNAARTAADRYHSRLPTSYLFDSYYTAASLNVFFGRFKHARLWLSKARGYDLANPAGLQLEACLEQILLEYEREYDPTLPWGEFDFARKGLSSSSPP